MSKDRRTKTIRNFNNRNIEVAFFDTLQDAKENILDLISSDCTVGIGNSKTLKNMNISQELMKRGNIVYDKTLAKGKEEIKKVKKKALLTDWYITGTNAISVDGHIVNIDHSGNRVAAMVFAPDKVIIVVGKNKLCETLEEAIKRARNISASLNAKRSGYSPPCIQMKQCIDCNTKDRVCFNLVIIEGQYDKERMKIFVVDEDLGF